MIGPMDNKRRLTAHCGALLFAVWLPGWATAETAYKAIPVEGFGDGVKHYRDGSGRDDYERYVPEQIVEIAANVLLYQRTNGGWPPNWDPLRVLAPEEMAQVVADKTKLDTSFDNRATYPQVEYLAHAFNQTHDAAYRDAALRGLDFIYAAQYASGGWPHSYPNGEGYKLHITFMDDVMTGVLRTLRKAAQGENPFGFLSDEQRARAAEAVKKGDACILRLQVVVDGMPTVWAGQYDRHTLQPAQGRSFELPGLVSAESVEVVRYLMSIEPPTPEIKRAVESAVRWFERSQIRGIRVDTTSIEPIRYEHHTATIDRIVVPDPDAPPIWSRFYEIGTNRPFMANRDGVKVYSLAEVQHERRSGYGWYTYAPAQLLERDYPAWQDRHAADFP